MSQVTKRPVEALDLADSLNDLFDVVKALKDRTKNWQFDKVKRKEIVDVGTFAAIEDRFCHTEISKAMDIIDEIQEELTIHLELAEENSQGTLFHENYKAALENHTSVK